MGKDYKNWRPPTADNPVDLAILNAHASTIILTCHCCKKEVFHWKPSTEPGVTEDVLTIAPTHGAGAFICTSCLQELKKNGEPKLARGSGRPQPYRKTWCVNCLKDPKLISGGFDSAFRQRDDGS